MNIKFKHILKPLVFITLFVGFSVVSYAAGPPGPPNGGGGPPGGCWPPSTCIPLDGGLSFLLMAGVAYGGKKMYDISKENKKAE